LSTETIEGDGRTVAVVHGRDVEARYAIERFLTGLGLVPLAFEAALLRTAGLPTTIAAVRQLFAGVQAAVVVFTPDDLAITHPAVDVSGGGQADTRYTGQPRQNVLIETGMAISVLPSNTILLRAGELRQASDLDGVNIIDIGGMGAAQRLARMLIRVGCVIPEERVEAAEIPGVDDVVRAAAGRRAEPTFSYRKVSIFEAARRAGLMDIEFRSEAGDLALPPGDFYHRARVELAISGVTAASTFQQHNGILREVLARGVTVRCMILSPSSPDLPRLSARELRPLRDDILGTVRTIYQDGFNGHPRFEVRFMPVMYPFTGVMIDGEIGAPSSVRLDELDKNFPADAELRVQPAGYNVTQHAGPILQFRRTDHLGPFHHFATDFRRQWASSMAIDSPELRGLFDGA
jgi:hypothetical protein